MNIRTVEPGGRPQNVMRKRAYSTGPPENETAATPSRCGRPGRFREVAVSWEPGSYRSENATITW